MSISSEDILTIDPTLFENTVRINMVVTASQKKDIEAEVDRAVEDHAKSIDEVNCDEIFAFRQHKGDIVWSVKTCNRCNRPTLVHADPWSSICLNTGEPVTQNITAEYIDALTSHKRLKQIVVWVMPDIKQQHQEDDLETHPHQRNSRSNYTHNKHHKFPLWEEGLAWEDYKKMMKLFVSVAKKEPAEIFLDMINALKESKRNSIATRLINKFENYSTNKSVIEDALTFIEAGYGTTLTDRLDKAAESLQTIRREDCEDISEFILRFEAMIEQLNMVKLDLTDRMEAAVLQRAANLTKAERNILVPLVDMKSLIATDLTTKTKDALRQICFRKEPEKKKEEVVLYHYDN